MNPTKISVKCDKCEQEYNDEFFLSLCKQFHYSFIPNNGFYTLNFSCSGCKNQLNAKFDSEFSDRIRERIKETVSSSEDEPFDPEFDDVWLDSQLDEIPESNVVSFSKENPDDLKVPMPVLVEKAEQRSVNSVEVPDSVQDEADTRSNIKKFLNEIKSIDRNLDEFDQSEKIREVLPLLVDELESDIESCWITLRKELDLTVRQIEAFKRDFKNIKKQIESQKIEEKNDRLLEKFNQKPKELTEQEKQEALAYLQDPNLISNISNDLAVAGGIIAEETNKMMLYLAAISRKFKKPISLVIFGKSSSGKSYLANTILDFVPPEDQLPISSASTRALNYAENLKHKFVLVQEWEGIEKILPTIRVLQSEGKLSHFVPLKGEDDTVHKSVAVSQECPCTVVFTTTREDIHDENSTRIFELYADESLAQTQHVVKKNFLNASLRHRKNESEKKRIINLHHNVQRVLEPLEIDIPFAEHINFPAKTTRHRRDSERFIQLIKAVAFLRQKQKQVKFHDGIKMIEADQYDYEIAYTYGIKVISQTMDQISDRSRNVLRVCCELADEMKRKNQAPVFTVSQIQEKAASLGVDFNIRQDLYKQLNKLTEFEYLTLDRPKPKGTKYYSVSFNYVRDQFGNLLNINTPEIKEITTPDELRQKLLAN